MFSGLWLMACGIARELGIIHIQFILFDETDSKIMTKYLRP